MERTARLTFGDQTIELPVVEGSEGELAVDITSLRARTGLITLDPGFSNTGVGQSSITYVDGENGVLRYRGIPIEQLARHSNFVETSFLLIYGHLPTKEELDRFSARVTANAGLHESFKHHFEGFPGRCPADGDAVGHGQHPGMFLPAAPAVGRETSSTRKRRGC